MEALQNEKMVWLEDTLLEAAKRIHKLKLTAELRATMTRKCLVYGRILHVGGSSQLLLLWSQCILRRATE